MDVKQVGCREFLEFLEGTLEKKLEEVIYFRPESHLAVLASAETYQSLAVALKTKRIHCAHESFISFSRYLTLDKKLQHSENWKPGASEWYFVLDNEAEINKFISTYGPYYQVEGAKVFREKVEQVKKKARNSSLYTLLGLGSIVASIPFNFNFLGDVLFGTGIISLTLNIEKAKNYLRYALSLKPKGKKKV